MFQSTVLNKMTKSNSIIFLLFSTVICATVSYFLIDRKEWIITKQKLLITTQVSEHSLMQAQLDDYKQHVFQFRQEEYRKGFEDGKTQTGIAFMDNDTLFGYSDGYHAAISQFGPADSNSTLTPFNSGFLIMYQEALAKDNEEDAAFYKDMIISQLNEDFHKMLHGTNTYTPVGNYRPVTGLSDEENELLYELEKDLGRERTIKDNFPKLNKRE